MTTKSNAIQHHYVSDIDRRLADFDRTHEWSPSQRAEIEKYKTIYNQRDHVVSVKQKENIWD